MATLAPLSAEHPSGLIPSGQLWLPRASLTHCLRASIVRNTVGHRLSDAQRINHFPASPLCSLSWWFIGYSETLVPRTTGGVGHLGCERLPMPGRWVLTGPQTVPSTSWCPEPTEGLMVLMQPDALHLLTGLEPEALTNCVVDAQAVLPSDWHPMLEAVQAQPDNARRLACLEDFLEPRWEACRPEQPGPGRSYSDWAQHLAQRAAMSAPGRSLRQLERRIKRWAGLPLRELRGMGKSEQAFFDALTAHVGQGTVSWAGVAASAGFADQSHLCRVTRRITGFSPQALYEGILRDEAFWAYRLWV